ncbi:MAG: uroporphyrinogen-III C-methyltransferase [Salinisphaera sp.]|jgi:uroporphyrin-3 C-methyltransferase|nr:uroporphyrinogen-III C-methyltransferase [Salinisphaera sp.]
MSEEQNKDGAKSKPDTSAKPNKSSAAASPASQSADSASKSSDSSGRKNPAASGSSPPASKSGGGKSGSSEPAAKNADQSSVDKSRASQPRAGSHKSAESRQPSSKASAATASQSDNAAKMPAAGKQPTPDQASADKSASDKVARDQRAIEQRVKDQAARDQAAKDRVAKFQTAQEQGAQGKSGKTESTQRPATSSRSSGSSASGTSAGAGGRAGSGASPPSHRSGGSSVSGRKSSNVALVVAVIALLLAIAAAAGAGWLWYRGQSQLANMNSRVNTVEQGMQANVQKVVKPRLSKMDGQIQSLSSKVGDLSSQQDQGKQQITQLQQSIKSLQSQNAKLADRLDGTHARFVEQRVESLLQAANQRLTIYKDTKASMQALKLADTAIKQAGDPRLFPVRKDIANEIASIKALPDADTEGLSLKLSNLISQVPKLPLETNVPSEYSGNSQGQGQQNSDNQSGQSGKDQTSQSLADRLTSIDVSAGWHHFVDSVSNALSQMVTVRRANGTENAPALMAPDQSYFLTQNLQLQLRGAQLALLNKDTQTYHQNLSSAKDWIKKYYSTGDSAVQAALDTLNDLSSVKLDWRAPDITASLAKLRQIMSSSAGGSAADQSGNGDNSSNGNSDGKSNGNSGSEQ